MSKHLGQIKRDRRRVWKRSNPTGFTRPHRISVRERFRVSSIAALLQKALMEAKLAELTPGLGVMATDEQTVKEIL
jgi:hypothetical protein